MNVITPPETFVQKKQKLKIFFPNLDGVRAIAAIMVVISHIEHHKETIGIKKFPSMNLIYLGPIGVTIFFALSGFLITYLLLKERELNNEIAYGNFYIRRILRIWPLYFFVFLVGYFIYPTNITGTASLLCIFLLPNVAFGLNLLPAIIDPIWSIGVEEQFYLFQPQLLKAKSLKKTLALMVFLIILIKAVKFSLPYWSLSEDAKKVIQTFCWFEIMLIGSIGAILFYNREQKIFSTVFPVGLFFNKKIHFVSLAVFLMYLVIIVAKSRVPSYSMLGLLAAINIVNFCKQEDTLLNLRGKFISGLGKISYGMYLLHKYPLFLVLFICGRYLKNSSSAIKNIFVYSLTIIITIIVAHISYTYFESYFLKFKNKYAKITKG